MFYIFIKNHITIIILLFLYFSCLSFCLSILIPGKLHIYLHNPFSTINIFCVFILCLHSFFNVYLLRKGMKPFVYSTIIEKKCHSVAHDKALQSFLYHLYFCGFILFYCFLLLVFYCTPFPKRYKTSLFTTL